MGFPENSGQSPQGVLLLNGRELLFGEAEECTARIVPLFDCGGKEKWRSQALSMCMNLHMG
jgi:hypothetical protein